MSVAIGSVVTCVGGASDGTLLRAGYNRARKLGVPWRVLHIETEAASKAFDDREALERLLSNAEATGAVVERSKAPDAAGGIVAFFNQQPEGAAAHLLIGERQCGLRRRLWRRKCVARHVQRALAGRHHVEVIPMAQTRTVAWHALFAPFFRGTGFAGLMEAVSFVALATFASELLRLILDANTFNLYSHNIALIFLIASAVTATRCGIIPALVASVISFVTLDFFYTPPYYTLHSKALPDIINLILFLSTAVFISLFGSGTHAYIKQTRERERYLQALVNISGTLNRSFTRAEALNYLHREMQALLRQEVAYFLPSAFNVDEVAVTYPQDVGLNDEAQAAFWQCWRDYFPTGYGTVHHAQAPWRFEVMMSAEGFVGVLGARVPQDSNLTRSFGLMLTVLADLSASILARIDLTQSMEENRVHEEREKLRSMVLSAVSHDLKTPLASIIGSLDIFHRLGANLKEDRRRALTQTAYDEAIRLDSFITNIIDMARIESGKLIVNREWTDPAQMLRRTLKRMEGRLNGRSMMLQLEKEPFEVDLDVGLMEKVLFHLLDNAAKYTPAGTPIHVALTRDGNVMRFIVSDNGSGVPEGMEDAIFNKYTRLHKKDMAVAGTGLGLPISRMIVTAHGGAIRTERSETGGARFIVELPQVRDAKLEKTPEETV